MGISTGYIEFRPYYTGEDYYLTITVSGTGSIAGWTLAGKLWDGTGTEIVNAVTVTITDAANRVILLTIAGQNLPALPYYQQYQFQLMRTDIGNRFVVAWGPIDIVDSHRPA